MLDASAEEGDEFLAVLAGVVEGVEAADEDLSDAEIVVGEEGLGDLLGCADEGRGVAVGADGLGGRRAGTRRRDRALEPYFGLDGATENYVGDRRHFAVVSDVECHAVPIATRR